MIPMIIGSIGVAILLLAFVLNILKRVSESDRSYLAMNVVGALLAAWYAWAGGAVPFVVLEGVWATVAMVRLAKYAKKSSRR